MSYPGYKEIENIYVNIVFGSSVNLVTVPGAGGPQILINENPRPAVYNVTKTQPIVDNCSDYFLSVIRFDIPLDLVPLFIMPIIPNQSNPNLTPLTIGITSGGVDFPQSVIYIPDNSYTAPLQDIPLSQVITPYYYVYTYQCLIDSINNAIKLAYVAAGSPGGGTIPPFIFFESDDQTINLIVSDSFIASGATIFCNEFIINYVDAIQAVFKGYNQYNGKDFVFVTKAYPGGTNIYTVPLDPTHVYYIFKNEYNVMVYWNSLSKIVVATNSMPVQREDVPAYNNNGSQSDVNNFYPILSDFVPQLDSTGDGRSIVYYNPTSQYRLVNMLKEGPLYNIDLRLLWQDKSGNLYPIYISFSQQASVKLAFVKKSLYKPKGMLLK